MTVTHAAHYVSRPLKQEKCHSEEREQTEPGDAHLITGISHHKSQKLGISSRTESNADNKQFCAVASDGL